MNVSTTRQYVEVPRGYKVTLYNSGDTLYVGSETVASGSYESAVTTGTSLAITAGRWVVSAGTSRVEEIFTAFATASRADAVMTGRRIVSEPFDVLAAAQDATSEVTSGT